MAQMTPTVPTKRTRRLGHVGDDTERCRESPGPPLSMARTTMPVTTCSPAPSRQEHAPTELHDLVVAEARQRPADEELDPADRIVLPKNASDAESDDQRVRHLQLVERRVSPKATVMPSRWRNGQRVAAEEDRDEDRARGRRAPCTRRSRTCRTSCPSTRRSSRRRSRSRLRARRTGCAWSRRSSAAKNRKNANGWTKMPHAFSPCQRDHVVEADRAVDHEGADER